MLRAYFAGATDPVWEHPVSRRWLARQAMDVELWKRGLVAEHDLVGVGRVRLALEQDLLEVLKLGTYVHSCLGLGGAFTYSAAAVAVDVNKRVVYARDARRRVVSRQLLAVSADGYLVAYAVYPPSTPAALVRSFDAYDRAFAAALGVPLLHDERRPGAAGDEVGTVERLLSAAFYDDGVWSGPRGASAEHPHPSEAVREESVNAAPSWPEH